MPLSEFYPAARNKLDSNHSKMNNANSSLPFSVPDGEFAELLWEDGQIVMQGQPSRSKKNSIPTFSSQPTKLQEKEDEGSVLQNICQFGVTDSVADDFSTTGISSQMGSHAQDDDMATWLNCPMDDFCLEFLSEYSGVNTSDLPVHKNSMPANKGSSTFSQVVRDSHSLDHNLSPRPVHGSSDPRIRNIEFNHMPQQSGPSDVAAVITTEPVCRNSNTWRLPDAKLRRQEPVSPKLPPPTPRATGSSGLVNFSHFTRPVALLKANLQSADRLRSNVKASTTTATTGPVGSTLIESSGVLKNVSQEGMVALVSDKCDVKSTTQPPAERISGKHSEASSMSPEHVSAKGFSSTASLPGSSYCTRNNNSEMVAASSVCSANGAHTIPNDAKQRDKRKIPEGEEYGYQSEDIDDESTVVKKTARSSGTATKRKRAAEVHNLSERRRRDRINVKMRALQELIPNCNKVDKASMLDEAIEYLKTLQLQVQIMSMGGGLCMPPMMLPPGVQHLWTPHMAHHYPPMGGGMGMGYGMGILDMIPPMQGPQFPCSVPGNLGMPVSDGLQMLGIPGQGLSAPITCRPQARTNTMPQVSGMQAASVRDAQMAPCVGLKDQQMQNLNLDAGHKAGIDDTHNQTCKRGNKEFREDLSTAQIKINASHSSGDGPLNSTSGNDNSSTDTSGSPC